MSKGGKAHNQKKQVADFQRLVFGSVELEVLSNEITH